ncbi:hypothetical protein [Clostridium felsineum]|uniref:hypothetical protein n=1 Tax=Clostridium felsineum TaxID=36839 RepID=UPI00098C7983|nr:hypothetical protein [Clostridium felsineum]URZ02573.1 hypothetical protein CLAUR_025850 [Clostridium felsineum]
MSEENKTSPFKINKDKLVDNVHDALVKNKIEMYKYKECIGQYYSNGLWGEIERINNILKEDYDITII